MNSEALQSLRLLDFSILYVVSRTGLHNFTKNSSKHYITISKDEKGLRKKFLIYKKNIERNCIKSISWQLSQSLPPPSGKKKQITFQVVLVVKN